MKIRNLVIMIIMISFSATSVMAGGSGESSTGDAVEMRIASTGGTDSVRGDALRLFQQKVKEKTNGAVIVKLYLDGQLGGDEDNTYQLQEGSVEAIFNGTAPHFLFGEEMSMEYWPFIFNDSDHLKAFYETSDFVAKVDEMLIAEMDIRPLVLGIRGPRHITSNVPVRTPADLEGLNFRVPGIDTVAKAFGELGARVVTMPVPELITSLETGQVDAQENPIDNIHSWGLYDVQDYITLTYHTYSGRMLYVNEKFWQSLSKDVQSSVMEAANEMVDYIAETVEDSDKKKLADLEDKGMEIIEADIDAFRNAFKDAISIMPKGYQDLYAEVRALVE